MPAEVSLPVLGTQRPVEVLVSETRPTGPIESLRLRADQFRPAGGHCYHVILPASMFGDDLPSGEIPATLIENAQILGPAGQAHALIRTQGRGTYSVWHNEEANEVTLFFSALDNSDPRENGRTYTLLTQPIEFANHWNHFQARSWLNHSRSAFFLKRGGTQVPPPVYASMGITDICNLQCGICGSQNMLTPVNRRHMDFRVFQMVADTIFPLLVCVELNSRGEPMIHPQFAEMLEIIHEYGIFMRLQTNGTQFQARKLALLSQMSGDVSVSIDATGELFEYARAGGKWVTVDQGMRNLMKMRKPERLGVGLYPTLTAKTLKGAPELIAWAMEIGVDRIDFHVYEPIAEGIEKAPTQEALEELKTHVRNLDPQHPIQIAVEFEVIKLGELPPVQRPPQMKWANLPRPVEYANAHPDYTCLAPVQNVEIDLDGSVCVCCRLQEKKLGNALTPDAFADCWFGDEYRAIRQSLRRSDCQPILEICRSCVNHYVGNSGTVHF